MECLGRLCPTDLSLINVPKFVIRAGIIPWMAPTKNSPGMLLLGIKDGKYTDFGGGCKGSKMELPFDCAVRELREEIGKTFQIDLNRITHIFISGKNKPHQVILFVQVDQLWIPRIPKGELESVEIVSFPRFSKMNKYRLQDSLKSIFEDVRSVLIGS